MTGQKESTRIAWVDTAKAIGIIFVVLGHHHEHQLYSYIYSFHMPLFFFVSGMMFRTNPGENWNQYVRKRAQTLLLPYFVFAFALYALWWFLGTFLDQGLLKGYSLSKNFIGVFYAQGQMEYMRWGLEMWFLPCLFLTTILYFPVAGLSFIHQCFTVAACAIVGFTLPELLPMRLPWSVDIALVALGFFWLGNLLREKIGSFKLKPLNVAILLSLLIINILGHHFHQQRVDIYQALYGNYLTFYLSAVSGILFYVLLARWLPAIGVIVFLGVNSLVIYMLHMRALTVLNFLSKKFPILLIDEHSIYGALAISLLQISILIPVIYILNRYFPYLLGKGFRNRKTEIQALT